MPPHGVNSMSLQSIGGGCLMLVRNRVRKSLLALLLMAACSVLPMAAWAQDKAKTGTEETKVAPKKAPKEVANATIVDIPYTKFTLDNGLTVIVHEDHKAPIVAINMWYHVGSA